MKKRVKIFNFIFCSVLIIMILPHLPISAKESPKVSVKGSNGRVKIIIPKTPKADDFYVSITEKERNIEEDFDLGIDGSQKRSLIIRGLYDGEYVVAVSARRAGEVLWYEEKIINVKTKINNDVKKVKPGDIITIGACNQDYELNNGMESIEWLVLSVEGDKILVISRYILDLMCFDNSNSATWESSSIRKWLNNDFYENVFSEKEKICICETSVFNDNYYDVDEGNDTRDKIFLLSYEEIDQFYLDEATIYNDPSKNHWDGFYSFEHGKVTEYVKKRYDLENDSAIKWGLSESWWTRTCRSGNSTVEAVRPIWITWYPLNIDWKYTHYESGKIIHGVRPAMYVNIDKISKVKASEGKNTKANKDSLDDIISNLKQGDIIKLGVLNVDEEFNDYQDYLYEYKEGIIYTKPSIEWRVICVEDDKALLLSEYGLCKKTFFEKDETESSNWADSYLRKWLNEDFYETTFSEAEKKYILKTELNNTYYSGYYYEKEYDNYLFDFCNVSEPNTKDKIFLLSFDDVTNNLYGFPDIDDYENQALRMCYDVKDKTKECDWWLRNYATAASEYNHKNGPIEIDVDGVIYIPYRFNSFMELPSAMIRPAMWISLKE